MTDLTNTEHDLLIELRTKMDGLSADVRALRTDYVLQVEFEPIKNLVYGMVGLLLAGIIGAALTAILRH